MYTQVLNKNFKKKKRKQIYQKIFFTLLALFLFRVGNSISLSSLDKDSLNQALNDASQNLYLTKIISMYSSGGATSINAFSLGIIPYINASIFIDLLGGIVKPLESLQEEGESGKKKLNFYKKVLAFFISIFQAYALLTYFKDYFYRFDTFSLSLSILTLVTGSMISIYLTNKIDSKGIGNGTSLIIFTNIVLAFFRNESFSFKSNAIEIFLLFLFFYCIIYLQKARVNIPLISARQLAFLQEEEKILVKNTKIKKDPQLERNGLSIKFNQAGIFPIIIASNLAPIFSFLQIQYSSAIIYSLYNILIIFLNCFYTLLFWDPEKISKQLSKASVSIIDVRPGKESVQYLQNIAKSSSLIGGIALSLLVIFYDLGVKIFDFPLLNKISISSLIIITGVAFDLQSSLSSIYQSLQDESIEKI